MAKWFHMQCFFKKSKVRKLEEIKGIETIRYEDQEKLRGIINGLVLYINHQYQYYQLNNLI